MADPFRILFVCTGNVCRSPMAQAMLAHRLRAALGDGADVFAVASAGTGALAGEPIEPHASDALTALGITMGDFIARDATAVMFETSDLILTATRQHRAAVVTAQPAVVRRAFTIKEFARLSGALTDADEPTGGTASERARAVVDRVAGKRGMLPPVTPREDDVDDPYRQPAKRFAETAATLQPAIDVVASLLVRVATEQSETSTARH